MVTKSLLDFGFIDHECLFEGVSTIAQGDELLITNVKFRSVGEKLGIEQGYRIVSAEVLAERPDKEWLFLPALALLLLVMALQYRRLKPVAGKLIAGAA